MLPPVSAMLIQHVLVRWRLVVVGEDVRPGTVDLELLIHQFLQLDDRAQRAAAQVVDALYDHAIMEPAGD